MAPHPSRREVLKWTAASALLPTLPVLASASPKKEVALRIAHLTDIHVQPELKAGIGMADALRIAQERRPKPDLILTGGDLIMDCSGTSATRAQDQWDIFNQVLKNELTTPIEHCLGNHDVFAMYRYSKGRQAGEPEYGKKWAMEILGLGHPYRSFDRAGWHFIVLDSTFPQTDSYTAKLDDEQFEWLVADLKKTPKTTPILVLSHIPILAACAYFDGNNEKTGNWVVPGSWMHIDARRITRAFYEHGGVKLALSGHMHLVDRVDYLGTTYLCNGAVSGAWWRGNYHECEPGFGEVTLYRDGTFDHKYVTTGWTADMKVSIPGVPVEVVA
ncbi:MAG TPA: metallophosphoesterase [Fimbriimonadaceae bacterium]|nr:metallophosphoesterase [Fimbriimonadaceae bacterium]HRJ32216.1 metallophosphoesterase [Fimbriimonadaceae bacterium]